MSNMTRDWLYRLCTFILMGVSSGRSAFGRKIFAWSSC